MEVQTEETIITTRTYTFKLTEDELTKALVDARPLQRELRKARNAQIAPHSNWATAGYAGHTPRTQKTKRAKTAKPLSLSAAQGSIDCPHGCGTIIKPRGLKMHERKRPRYQLHKVAAKAQASVLAND